MMLNRRVRNGLFISYMGLVAYNTGVHVNNAYKASQEASNPLASVQVQEAWTSYAKENVVRATDYKVFIPLSAKIDPVEEPDECLEEKLAND